MRGDEDALVTALKGKRIAVVGAGGTGCQVIPILSRLKADLIIIDRDVVEEGNVARQILYKKQDVGAPKAIIAAKQFGQEGFFEDLNHKNINELLKGADFIFDCTDNIETRLLINDYCIKNRIPWVHTSASQHTGEVLMVTGTPCYRCVLGEKHGETCDSDVMMGALRGTAAIAVAITANYFATGAIEDELVRASAKEQTVMKFIVKPDPNCPACHGKYEYLDGKRAPSRLCGSGRFMIDLEKEIDLGKAAGNLTGIRAKTASAIITDKFTIMKNGRVIVKAESEKGAKKLLNNILLA